MVGEVLAEEQCGVAGDVDELGGSDQRGVGFPAPGRERPLLLPDRGSV